MIRSLEMAFVGTLPLPDPRYNAYRAKLCLLQILQMRGYSLGSEEYMLAQSKKSKKDGYEQFKLELEQKYEEYEALEMSKSKKNALEEVRSDLPSSVSYIHPRGRISPLRVTFLSTASVRSRLSEILGPRSSSAAKTAQQLHILFVVDQPREVTSNDAGLLGTDTLEILSYQRLLFNPLEHFRAPISVEKLTPEDKMELLSSPGLEGKGLKTILPYDPVALFLDIRPDDVCRTVDVSVSVGQNQTTIDYRRSPKSSNCIGENCTKLAYTFRSRYCEDCVINT